MFVSSGLIIDEPWISHILQGRKTWEMRSTGVNKRGRIALIAKGTKSVVGIATLTDCIGPLDDDAVIRSMPNHLVPLRSIGRWRHAWVLADAIPIRPVRYVHPKGAVK